MSLGKRLVDLARANLNALLDRAETGLDEFSDDELLAELELRQARRRRDEELRTGRETAERAARARAAERARTRTGSSAAGGARGSPRAESDRARLARLYAQLETPYGADLDTVKRNFRRLMRKVHPDLQAQTPERQKSATELTKNLTLAYNDLERLLTPKR